MGKRKSKLFLSCLIIFTVLLSVSLISPNVKATSQPFTQTFSSSSSDGYITTPAWDANYTTIHDKQSATVYSGLDYVEVGQQYFAALGYQIQRAYIFWDTSDIPDNANITEVKISFYLKYNESDTDFNITVQNGQPSYPHDPIVGNDYYYAYYSGNGGQFNTSNLASGYNNMTLNSTGRSWISDTGTTKLTLRSDREINSTVPTQFECIQFWTSEKGEAYSPKLYVTWQTEYTFYGVYDEDTGLLKSPSQRAVNVTVYFTDNTTFTFELNGTYSYGPSTQPLYFRFDLTNDREYWLGDDEAEATIYVFDGTTTVYTIVFLDLAGALDDRPFVEAKRYINGSLMTIEKRKADVEKKVSMSLINGATYTITIQNGSTYTFGDLLMTSATTIQLTLKGIEFPKETLLIYKYVRIYGTRAWSDNLAYALSYDGINDYVQIPDDNSLDGMSELTISAWINIENYIAGTGQIILMKSDSYKLSLENDLALNMAINATDYTAANDTVTLGTWQYVTGVYNSSAVLLYVNGELIYTQTGLSGSIAANANVVTISRSSYTFDGIVDEVRIYNRSKLESEITYSYNNGVGRYLPSNQTGLVGWWHFDEGTETTAYDETANNNDGTIYGASWASSTVALGFGTITIIYQDTLEQTTSVGIYINYKNGTNIYNAVETADSFVHVWASTLDSIDYAVVVNIDHQRFGTYSWKNYFPRSFSNTAPWGLGFLGSLPFDTSIIIPMFLILFVAGAFSQINAEVGAFMAVVTAALLTAMRWIPIEPGALITGFALACLMAIIYAKRKVQVY